MIYDLVILGAGAAGMTASIYASRYKINHLIFGAKIGGQFVDAHIIENYPGTVSITGADLAENFRQHVASYGVTIKEEKVAGIKKIDLINLISNSPKQAPMTNSLGQLDQLEISNLRGSREQYVFEVSTESGEKLQTRSMILAMGAQHRALNIPGEQNFLGRGVSYCSTCDAPLFRGKTVAVVGGGNSAITAALHLSEFASRVYLIHRRDKFDKSEPVWLEALEKKQNITKIYNTQVKEIFGAAGATVVSPQPGAKEGLDYAQRRAQGVPQSPPDSGAPSTLAFERNLVANKQEKTPVLTTTTYDVVKGVVLSQPFEGANTLELDGVFVEIGLMPAASLANQVGVTVDPLGYITAKGDLSTNVAGIFAAGDLVKHSDVPQLRQMITSAAQGAIAATSVYSFLNKKAPAPDWG